MPNAVEYSKNVFINCPFDEDYNEIFNAILFAVHSCGFRLRCAKEFHDSSSVRIQNIIKLVAESKYSIHDLSRVTLDAIGKLPRFNMPLELGICMGAIAFGTKQQRDKEYLILESEQFRFKQFISDISGQDIKAHKNSSDEVIKCIRNWLVKKTEDTIPSASVISTDYARFLKALPELCKDSRWEVSELTFDEYSSLVTAWLTLSRG